ncbi:MAG: M48 family metallopeptidase [Patescibacteria group bacterium]
MFFRKRIRIVRKRAATVTKHYVSHKEEARAFVLARLLHFNQHYQLSWNRVAIRNQRRCWGSCSAKGNLNFNYKILFLPAQLADYIIVHELCHLTHLHHGKVFWDLVAEQIPDYRKSLLELREIDKRGHGALLK